MAGGRWAEGTPHNPRTREHGLGVMGRGLGSELKPLKNLKDVLNKRHEKADYF